MLIDRSNQQADQISTPVYESPSTSVPNVVVYDHISQSAEVNRDPAVKSTNDYEAIDAVAYSN